MLLNKEKLKKNLKKFPLLFNFIKKIFIFFNINHAAKLTKINITEHKYCCRIFKASGRQATIVFSAQRIE